MLLKEKLGERNFEDVFMKKGEENIEVFCYEKNFQDFFEEKLGEKNSEFSLKKKRRSKNLQGLSYAKKLDQKFH